MTVEAADPYRIAIIDDHPVFRKGLRAIFNNKPQFSIVAEGSSGLEALEVVRTQQPDCIVMDINMPDMDGIEATAKILKDHPNTNIIALSINSGRQAVKGMLDAGAKGYLLKESAPDELIIAINKVRKGDMYLSSQVTSTALSEASEKDKEPTLLAVRFNPPRLTTDLITRSSIIEEMEQHQEKLLTLVSAPAGFGKSVVISQYLQVSNQPFGWVTLDEELDDINTFLWYLLMAFKTSFPDHFKALRQLLSSEEEANDDELHTALSNAIHGISEEVTLVLDNFQTIHDKKILVLIERLLQNAPPNFHMIIMTRRDPALKLSALKSRGLLHEIRMMQLSFSTTEIGLLFERLLGSQLNEDTLNNLMRRTEGWIAGLRLMATLIPNKERADEILAAEDVSLHVISDYVLSEVFTKQSEKVREILMQLSLLETFNATLIDEVLLKDSKAEIKGQEIINQFERSNLFVVPLDHSHEWFRFHHQFRQILLQQLALNAQPEDIATLTDELGQWFKTHHIDKKMGIFNPLVDGKEHRPGPGPDSSLSSVELPVFSRKASMELLTPLTIRENEIMALVAEGLRNQEIADTLFVSTETVKKHLYNVFRKMQVSNRTQLVNKAKELGMISNS